VRFKARAFPPDHVIELHFRRHIAAHDIAKPQSQKLSLGTAGDATEIIADGQEISSSVCGREGGHIDGGAIPLDCFCVSPCHGVSFRAAEDVRGSAFHVQEGRRILAADASLRQ